MHRSPKPVDNVPLPFPFLKVKTEKQKTAEILHSVYSSEKTQGLWPQDQTLIKMIHDDSLKEINKALRELVRSMS